MMKLSISRFVVPAVLALAVPTLGCSGSASSTEPPVTADTATTRAPVAQTAHGPLKVMGDALGDVPLTASQRAQIERLASDAEARHAQDRAARKDLMLAVAAQVQAGQIDRAALQPKIDALVATLQTQQPADRAAFEQLHALLTPDQRVAFVDALKARVGERVHAAVEKHPMKQWAEDLKLTDDQKAQIKAAMQQRFEAMAKERGGERPWAQAKEHGEKVLSAFVQDRFVMDEVVPQKDLTQKVSRGSDRLLGMVEAALPVLTPEQRATAAQKIRDRADSVEETGEATP